MSKINHIQNYRFLFSQSKDGKRSGFVVLLSTDLHMELFLRMGSDQKVRTMLIRWNEMHCDPHRDQRHRRTCHAPLPFLSWRTSWRENPLTPLSRGSGFLEGGCGIYLETQRDEGEKTELDLLWMSKLYWDVIRFKEEYFKRQIRNKCFTNRIKNIYNGKCQQCLNMFFIFNFNLI